VSGRFYICLASKSLTICSGDKPLYHALQLMNDEGISSLAVVDNHANVVGNISTVDVKVCHMCVL
jgi:CBS domain-containing protein